MINAKESNIPILEPTTESKDFTLKELKDSIPDRYFQPSLWKSISYFGFDITMIFSLLGLAIWLDSWYFYPLYWFWQGTFFWSLFVVGHDCGHGSFSKSKTINNFFGQIAHSLILVPFHGWRISHRTHHNNTGNMDKDESWYPIDKETYDSMSKVSKFFRYHFLLLVFPLYLFVRSSGRDGSHFHPGSDLFRPEEKWDVLSSSFFVFLTLSVYITLGVIFSFSDVFLLFFIPYTVFVIWLSLVTYLHHTEKDVPWYQTKHWNYVKGALSTVDRKYGFIEPIHHNIGTHVVHHIFPKIPHYHLLEANAFLKEKLGSNLRVSQKPILSTFLDSYKNCRYVVPEDGKMMYRPED